MVFFRLGSELSLLFTDISAPLGLATLDATRQKTRGSTPWTMQSYEQIR